VRVNDKEGEAGNSGGLRRETAKSTHTPVLDWMQQHRRRNWRSCNRIISAWLGHNFDACISGRIVAFAVGYVRTYYNPNVENNATKTGCKSYVGGRYSKSISAMEIITENLLVFLIPGYSCTQD
jgi:hypothetical protein